MQSHSRTVFLNILAFDTSTDALSVALRVGDAVREQRGPGGAQASATLLPMLRQLLADGGIALASLDAIAFGAGPGSFTGLRTACSVAQGLAFAADVRVLPVETLMAVAEEARLLAGAEQVLAVLDARMDEVYAASYLFRAGAWMRDGAITLGAPEQLVMAPGWTLAGNAAGPYGARLPAGLHIDAVPLATALVRLAPGLLAAGLGRAAEQALPLYVRDKVAQTTEERMSARAAAAQARMSP